MLPRQHPDALRRLQTRRWQRFLRMLAKPCRPALILALSCALTLTLAGLRASGQGAQDHPRPGATDPLGNRGRDALFP